MSSNNGTDTPTSATPSPSQPPNSQTDEPSPSAPPPTSQSPDVPSSTPPSPPPPPSSEPPPPPPSSSDAPSSTPRPSSSARPPPPASTSTVTASPRPDTTQIVTSVVTPTPTADGETPAPSTVVLTVTTPPTDAVQPTDSAGEAAASSTPTTPADLQRLNGSKDGGGLSSGGKIGIAVAVPVVVVALLVLAGILFWRKRKQRKHAEEARRKEVEEYGFNPNNDPSLPATGIVSEMSEDQSGYRGWGNTTTGSNRKASTTLTSGMTYSDSTSNPGGPHSPTHAYSDGYSNDPLVNGRRETLDSEGLGAMAAGANMPQNQAGVHRGASNASSSYSAANRSDNSGDYPIPATNPQDYYDGNNNFYHASPYNDGYAGQAPIIRDVSARRNTRIENPAYTPHQGNSGIAQNF